MSDSQSEKYEQQIKSSAEKALGELPEDQRESAQAARTTLFNWLIEVDRRYQDASEIADDPLANTACNVLGEITTRRAKAGPKKEQRARWAAVNQAFAGLNDEEQLNLFRELLGQTFLRHSTGSALVCRQPGAYVWEHLGFHVEGDLKSVFAKSGTNPYQPVGFTDGEHYIGTEGSKTLWARNFGMALILPFPPAFHVERTEGSGVTDPEAGLTDKEREKVGEALAWFEEDLHNIGQLKPEEKEQRRELQSKMRETLKLARIRLPRLDHMIDSFLSEHPEAGENLENIDIVQMVVSASEYLRMKLDDDQVRRQIEQTTISTGTIHEEQRRLLQTLIEGLRQALPREDQAPDAELLIRRISEASIAVPAIRSVLDELGPETTAEHAAGVALKWLEKERLAIPEVVPPPDESAGE